MKYSIVLAAIAATVSSIPTPPQQINAGPFSLKLEAPGTEYHGLFISLHPTSSHESNNHKSLAITSTSKTPSPRFEITYNHPAEDPRIPPHGKLIYTPGSTPEECKFFSCPPKAIPAGYDEQFGPVEYVRNNMRAVFFPAAGDASLVRTAVGTPKNVEEQVKVWADFQLDFSGYLTLNGKSNWWSCPTKYPFEAEKTYSSIWWADGAVSDDRCKPVKVRRA
ncbi:hypothetical protein ABW19_dt0206474 [Dactylella cylindrospora]|nr:hypothetical protein ABW19_dt0206474 [Dactylella cylindrospora]